MDLKSQKENYWTCTVATFSNITNLFIFQILRGDSSQFMNASVHDSVFVAAMFGLQKCKIRLLWLNFCHRFHSLNLLTFEGK